MLNRLRPAHIARWVVRPIFDVLRDRLHRIDTAGPVRHDGLGFESTEGLDYVPSDWKVLRKMLRPADVHAGDVFLDVGCGKGLVLWLASEYRFSRLIGVELSPDLCRIANKNVAAVRKKNPALRIDVINTNASEFEIPDEVTHIYMYNPFDEAVLAAFLARLRESLARKSRPVSLIYNNPVLDDLVQGFGFRLVKSHTFLATPPHRIASYEYGHDVT